MKKIISLITLLSFAFVGIAQDQATDEEIVPKKGNFMVSVNFGVGSYIGWAAPRPDLSEYTLSAPMSAWFDKKPMLDVEGRWMMTDKWALKLTGGFAYGYNPGYGEVPGTGDNGEFELGDIPSYNAVPNSNNLQFAVGIGADHYFKTKSDRLFMRLGGEAGFAYGRVTAKADSEKYTGASIGEAYAFRVAPICGIDYFFAKQLYLGIEVRPIAYQYSVYSERPQAGLSLLSSDNHTFSFIAQPMIKLGFRF